MAVLFSLLKFIFIAWGYDGCLFTQQRKYGGDSYPTQLVDEATMRSRGNASHYQDAFLRLFCADDVNVNGLLTSEID